MKRNGCRCDRHDSAIDARAIDALGESPARAPEEP